MRVTFPTAAGMDDSQMFCLYFREVAMTRVSLTLGLIPAILFGFIAAAGAQHPPSGPQRRDRPSGQFVNYNGQLRWVSPTMLTLTQTPRPSALSSPGPYAGGTPLPLLRGSKNSYARSRSPRLRHSHRSVLQAPPSGRPAQFLQPSTLRQPQAPQPHFVPTLFGPRP
jgi:hypothetical protein